MLLAPKVTQEIAETRGIEVNQDCISPAKHTEFSNPEELLKFADKLRKLSGGKPVGIKLCRSSVGNYFYYKNNDD